MRLSPAPITWIEQSLSNPLLIPSLRYVWLDVGTRLFACIRLLRLRNDRDGKKTQPPPQKKTDELDCPILLDFNFLPGRGVSEIISHYRDEGEALMESSKHPGESFHGVAVLIPRKSLEDGRHDFDLVLFDPPAEHLREPPEEREAAPFLETASAMMVSWP